MIIATAGHIDHGKTVLVRALTGVDTDRLPEEKRRGVSIDLGFAYDTLPDGSPVGFVDVPGHERFVRNMLAGVTGIDFALLVVAADDGPMPQTEEHLAILDLLGLRHGCIALTKIDRVSPDRLEDAKEELAILVDGTSLADAPVFPVSGLTGDGIPELKAHIEAAAAAHAEDRGKGQFRLAVDRCFTLPGAGLVVTGTAFSGAVAVGDRLVLSPRGVPVRVRGIHAQNRESETGHAGERCALNITGSDLSRDVVHRGDWVLAAPAHAPTDRIDARVRLLASEKRPLRHWTPVHLHLGASDINARVAVLDGANIPPGGAGRVQLVLDRQTGAVYGDKLILRDQSAQRTIGGGVVIDPFSPRRGRRRPERLAFLDAIEQDTPAARLAALLEQSPTGVDLTRLSRACNWTAEEAEALWREADMVRLGRPDAPIGLSPGHWQQLVEAAYEALRIWHERWPDQPGPGEERLRLSLSLRYPVDLFAAAVLDLIRQNRFARDGSTLCLPSHRPALAPEDAGLWERLQPLLEADDLRPPRVRELAEELDIDLRKLEAMLARSVRMGLLYRVADNRYYLPDTVRRLAVVAERLAADSANAQFDARAYRDATDIGRNVAIQVLEFFDKQGFTRRLGDGREIRKPSVVVFG
ncbi:MAG: selenocysteine-specific translation elongation factor [Alphaproteobacteria bacterium]|nr:selenocysteine-specific translation elongation factor [Alphaproteobacteria bacterium]